MPDAVEAILLSFAQSIEMETGAQPIENHPVEPIERRPRQLAAIHNFHGGRVAGAPGVGERGPVYMQVFQPAQFPALPNDCGSPIHHCAENVKRKCFYPVHTVILAL